MALDRVWQQDADGDYIDLLDDEDFNETMMAKGKNSLRFTKPGQKARVLQPFFIRTNATVTRQVHLFNEDANFSGLSAAVEIFLQNGQRGIRARNNIN